MMMPPQIQCDGMGCLPTKTVTNVCWASRADKNTKLVQYSIFNALLRVSKLVVVVVSERKFKTKA